MATPFQFSPGPLSREAAAALTALSRSLSGQAAISVYPPLALARQGYDGQPVVYLDTSGFVLKSRSASSSGAATPGALFGFDVTDLQCLDGVLWVVKRPSYWDPANGVTYGAAYYSHTAGCCDCPASSGSGGTSPPPPPPPGGGTGGTATCCGRPLSDTLYAALSGGQGTITLTWDGTHWVGSAALPCGVTLGVRMATSCGVEAEADGGGWAPVPMDGETLVCGPPFAYSTALLALGAPCGTLSMTISE